MTVSDHGECGTGVSMTALKQRSRDARNPSIRCPPPTGKPKERRRVRGGTARNLGKTGKPEEEEMNGEGRKGMDVRT